MWPSSGVSGFVTYSDHHASGCRTERIDVRYEVDASTAHVCHERILPRSVVLHRRAELCWIRRRLREVCIDRCTVANTSQPYGLTLALPAVSGLSTASEPTVMPNRLRRSLADGILAAIQLCRSAEYGGSDLTRTSDGSRATSTRVTHRVQDSVQVLRMFAQTSCGGGGVASPITLQVP